jgi:hypothetical protein
MTTMMMITTGALIARINRRLAHDGQRLRTTRGTRMIAAVGEHWVQDTRRSSVVERQVDVEELAERLGVVRFRRVA